MNPAIKTAINIVGSQKKLGDACEVSQQAVYKWLHNKAKVTALTDNTQGATGLELYEVYNNGYP
ncbi:TPA: helix-turn-helix domain-containing protein [Escherichia coli]|uniref:YdaS family helix-turn-helix protein n=1 Tax=Escherichia coli TaxID=562 RepID=UPI0018A8E9B2|nr:hypothetical protein [Escherichia coli]MDM1243153.1 helix-turn-helix domain-containing protein [Escherichia coli]HBB4630447.1 helix-turn-helix domain-containing protein [Escherichia coli]